MRPQRTRIVASVLITIALIAGAMLYVRDTTDDPDAITVVPTTTPNTPFVLAETDTDQDQLKDWEEALWNTDPKNPDSDGDGTLDGEEVRNERDPRTPGPDDALLRGASGMLPTPPSSQNETDALARSLVTAYLLDPGGASADELAESLAKEARGGATQHTPLHTLSELTVRDTPPHEYGNAAGAVLAERLAGVEHELFILYTALVIKQKGYLQNLFKTQAAYLETADGLIGIGVPQDIAATHLDLINSFELVAADLEGLAKIEVDPVVGLVALNSYSAHADELDAAFNALARYLDGNTEFEEYEGGYVFTRTLAPGT